MRTQSLARFQYRTNEISLRYAALMYTEEGRGMMDRLWRETIEEFKKISALADEYCGRAG